MNDESRLYELLQSWYEMRDQGQHVSAEELCRDCPELLDELRRGIQRQESMDQLLPLHPDGDSPQGIEQCDLPRQLGKYQLQERIGQGGSGDVWKAFDPNLKRLVAIKVPRRERQMLGSQTERFADEAQKVAKLRHPNIVAVHEFDGDKGYCYFVADLIEGTDLAERMKQGRLLASEAVDIVAKVADALHYSHEQGIIHRDIKPQNILLDEHNEPFITDFGIAVTDEALRVGNYDAAGTPAYVSPEQVDPDRPPLDRRTDIYSLGVVLYELLVGKLPFEAPTLQILRQKLQGPPPPSPRDVNPSIPLHLSDVCMKAMAHSPARRWRSAAKFAAALRASLAVPRSVSLPTVRIVLAVAAVVVLLVLLSPLLRNVTHHDAEPKPSDAAITEREDTPDGAPVVATPAPSDLLLYMSFDEGTYRNDDDGLVVDDLSGTENHGFGRRVEIVSGGVHGNALSIINGQLRLRRVVLNKLPEYTLAFWLLPQTADMSYREVSKSDIKNFEFTDGTFLNAFNRELASIHEWKGGAATSKPLPLRTWSFLACAFKADNNTSGTARVFVNDTSFEVQSQMVDHNFSGYGEIKGERCTIDEFRIFSRVLSDDQIRELYQRGRAELEWRAK